MAGVLQNRTIKQGESVTITVTEKDSAVPPVEVDLTGATLKWELWHPLKGAVVTKSTIAGITIRNQLTYKGQCQVALTKTDTAVLAPLSYWQGLFHDPLIGDSDLVMEGYIIVKSSRGLEL